MSEKYQTINLSMGFIIDYLHPYKSGCNVRCRITLIIELYHFFEHKQLAYSA